MISAQQKSHYIAAATILGVFPPILILLHECVHCFAAMVLGFDPILTYAETLILPPQIVDPTNLAIITASGPLVELVLALWAIWWLSSNRRNQNANLRYSTWVFSAFALSGLRWCKVVFDGIHSDEAWLSTFLGLDHHLLPFTFLPLSFVAAFSLFRFHREHRTLRPFGVGFGLSIVSGMLWLGLLGPKLLPYPKMPNKRVEINLRPVVALTHGCSSNIIVPIYACSRWQVTHS
tara:strand:- start:2653 stop:3354 length:702 start_codon:yes stop_codon:yes gene_type:complete